MNVGSTTLPDGRYLIFYEFSGADWKSVTGAQPNVEGTPRLGDDRSSELRWNPLLGEWLVTATHRQNRTFLPPADFCPFCPAHGEFGEVGDERYDIAVLLNRFPSLQPAPGKPTVEANSLYPVRPAQGVCEVVLYSAVHELTLAQAPVEQIYKLVLVWTSRYSQLSKLRFVDYVFIFENKGEAIGVTLNHPHGQIYSYPYVPERIKKEMYQSKDYQETVGECLICDIVTQEQRDGRRIVTQNESFVAFVPFFARWSYEVHVVSRRHLQSLDHLEFGEQRDLASILKALLVAYDGVFALSFPYMMVMHQQPCDGQSYGYYHFHIEFYPPLRTATKLKYLAGSETGAGMFINDSLPETTAAALRKHVAPVLWVNQEIR
jgi:UDPglucose--hexose-1-phosphate uridylyltransferase